jgi:hypothetical protein
MDSKQKPPKKKRPQRPSVLEFEPDEWVYPKDAPKKRHSIRKYYPMKVDYNSLEEEDYLEVADQIQGLDPETHRMTILTSEGQQEWDQDDDDV